ncbi:MAG: glk [Alphaproteobacteria bacterium]|nr:glk [Alphaproteobacteria bacterium]
MDILADIGATNARFGVQAGPGKVDRSHIFKCEDYETFQDAYRAYLIHAGIAQSEVKRAALAIAGPVTSDHIRMTNHPWLFSRKAVQKELKLERFVVINDFTAVALSLTELKEEDTVLIGERGRPNPDFPIAVLGPGTGLGVSALVPDGRGGHVPLPGEGGHVTMPAYTDREAEILHVMREWFGHVSAERILCGTGLVNLYRAIATIDHKELRQLKPENITKAALDGSDDVAVETLMVFCAMLGTVAGNLALTTWSRAGVYIAGGIVPQILPFFKRSPFRDRFRAKGRFENHMSAIPTHVITHPLVAFLGLEASLKCDRY